MLWRLGLSNNVRPDTRVHSCAREALSSEIFKSISQFQIEVNSFAKQN